jgi:hypothetical protein
VLNHPFFQTAMHILQGLVIAFVCWLAQNHSMNQARIQHLESNVAQMKEQRAEDRELMKTIYAINERLTRIETILKIEQK